MPKPREQQISLKATPYYHCISRCVRRAFLCGTDNITGNSYEHRRSWLENKLLDLPQIFAIDIAAYAIMSNHYHVVLHVDSDRCNLWSDIEVVERWHQLFKGNLLSQRFVRGEVLPQAETRVLKEKIELWRSRLMDISWFMRILNETIAREANLEDDCTGRFWEGRFKSQALLDEAALAACMAYVDLNPVRASMAKTPEKSDHTSVKQRAEKAKIASCPNHLYQQPKQLLPFAGNPRQNMPKGIAMRLTDYLELVDATGRIIRSDKRGAIPDSATTILDRLGINSDQWLTMTQQFEECFTTFAGHETSLRTACEKLDYQRPSGLSRCRRAFG
ncbi:transposase [Thalassolituus alkanivorans]|uniref:transposase n=2 Tax=Thalassolituus alkanivorans TaxID=2881055 RepID=UPI001E57A96F|nr:transposase [Thalassolituus alkanivorans]MCB2424839.1 transposase [Thalassolituus alkanivorans]